MVSEDYATKGVIEAMRLAGVKPIKDVEEMTRCSIAPEAFQSSDQLDQLAAALAMAQQEIRGAIKDSNNPYFKSKYADLASVWEAWQEVGPKHGLAVYQTPLCGNTGVMVPTSVCILTMLVHKSGQYMASTMAMPLPEKERCNPQAVGSAITYGRRYMLAAVVGIAPEDDDGNTASGKNSKQAKDSSQPDVDGRATTRKALEEAARKYATDANRLHLVALEAKRLGFDDLADKIARK